MTTPTDWRALCAELLSALENEGYAHWVIRPDEDKLCLRARAALAQPEPEGPTDDELLALTDYGVSAESIGPLVSTILSRWGRPAIKPVPVAERPWEREGWCDAEGNLWAEHISREGTASWRYANRDFLGGWCQRCIPHHALPLPTP